MEVYAIEDRGVYVQGQIDLSEKKFDYCKVSIKDVIKYRQILKQSRPNEQPSWGPICCLGTRNGREMDLFRLEFFGSNAQQWMVRLNEKYTHSYVSRVPALDAVDRSSVDAITDRSVIGVELNPHAARSDVWVGSFDEMPKEWAGRFGIVYANTLDHAQDPQKCANEWKRIVRPGGYLVLCYTRTRPPSFTDPVGGMQLSDMLGLFGGEMVYFCERGSSKYFCELILRMQNG